MKNKHFTIKDAVEKYPGVNFFVSPHGDYFVQILNRKRGISVSAKQDGRPVLIDLTSILPFEMHPASEEQIEALSKEKILFGSVENLEDFVDNNKDLLEPHRRLTSKTVKKFIYHPNSGVSSMAAELLLCRAAIEKYQDLIVAKELELKRIQNQEIE